MVKCITVNGKKYPLYDERESTYIYVEHDGSLSSVSKKDVDAGKDTWISKYEPLSEKMDLGLLPAPKYQQKKFSRANIARKKKYYGEGACDFE